MQITVVAVMCHVVGAVVAEGVGTLPEAVCREVIVIKQDMPMQACMLPSRHANGLVPAYRLLTFRTFDDPDQRHE
jgi:hypothetical protein